MKRTHKGFTLVELLIVIAVIATLATMMTMSSTDAVDSARANTIIGNLTSLKTAAYQMYMHEPVGMLEIKFDGSTTIGDEGSTKTVAQVLARYLGKEADIITTGNYGLVGDTTNGWYVVYKIATTDSSGTKAKLVASASKVELFGAKGDTMTYLAGGTITTTEGEGENAKTTTTTVNAATYYTGADDELYVALKVR